MVRVLLFLALASGAASSADGQVLSPDEFEALSRGRTLHFTLDGQPFGSEQYFGGRRSLWRFADGTCEAGVWDGEGDRVCFVYEGDAAPQCWRFRRSGSALEAVLVEDGTEVTPPIDLSRTDTEPLDCPGPDVGS